MGWRGPTFSQDPADVHKQALAEHYRVNTEEWGAELRSSPADADALRHRASALARRAVTSPPGGASAQTALAAKGGEGRGLSASTAGFAQLHGGNSWRCEVVGEHAHICMITYDPARPSQSLAGCDTSFWSLPLGRLPSRTGTVQPARSESGLPARAESPTCGGGKGADSIRFDSMLARPGDGRLRSSARPGCGQQQGQQRQRRGASGAARAVCLAYSVPCLPVHM